MNKTKDIIYAILFGALLYLVGAIILGAVEYLIDLYIGIDFVSILLYFFLARYITSQLMKGINNGGKFYTILFCIYTGLMFVLKNFVSTFVLLMVSGYSFVEILPLIPMTILGRIISVFKLDLSVNGALASIVNLLMLIIDLLIMGDGIYDAYKITKRYEY